MSTTSEIVQLGNANVDSLRILDSKALCKPNNKLVEKVKLLRGNKDKSPIFSVISMTDDEKCKHYTGFLRCAVFIAVFDLLEPGMNSENVKLVSVPNAYTGRARMTTAQWQRAVSLNTAEVMERPLHLTSGVAV